MRNKIISIRVDENKYNQFLQIIEKFTTVYTLDFPSRTEKRYHTKFPDNSYTNYEKYTLGDLVNEALTEFLNKYKTDV